jgi:hypothetical protein
MTANTPTQKSNQAAIMASTGIKVTDQVTSFDRFLAVVAGQPCQHSTRNGHITPEAATRCGLAMAEAELASLPAEIDLEAKLAAVAVTLVTQPRFKCSKGCPFGHKTQTQAEACSQGSQAKAARAVKASIPVTTSGSLAALLATQATPAKAEAEAEAIAKAAQAEAKAGIKGRATKLRSGSQGSTSKA